MGCKVVYVGVVPQRCSPVCSALPQAPLLGRLSATELPSADRVGAFYLASKLSRTLP